MRLGASAAAWWLWVLLAAGSAQAGTTVYKKLGDKVVLTSDSVPDVIQVIMWREGNDLAMEWERSDGNTVAYRQFQARGSLNTSSGQMTITGLTPEDSNTYTVEINSNVVATFDLRVISAVAVPNVTPSCNPEMTSCRLTCDGSSADAEPVAYAWKSGNRTLGSSLRQLEITKDNSSMKRITCELSNPVSVKSSRAVDNPLLPDAPPAEDESQAKVTTGVTVFVCLLVPVLLLIFIHRCKAGMWFFEKESMPWEQDFWRKENPPEGRADHEGQTEEQRLTNNGSSGPVDGQCGSEM